MSSEAESSAYLAAQLRSAHREIRRLRLRLALATSRVTPWLDQWCEFSPRNAAIYVSVYNDTGVRLGDGTPEQEMI